MLSSQSSETHSKSLRTSFLGKVFILICIIGILYQLDSYSKNFWIFDPNELHSIAKQAIKENNSTAKIIHRIVTDLNIKYPGHINLEEKWIFNNAGGAMGAMYLIHCSITEYVIIFGTPVGTEGHSGRHIADDYFIILEGEQWAFSPGQFDKQVFYPGMIHHLPRGEAQQYVMPDKCWALEYARGWIPTMLPFGVADILFSTLDFPTLYHTFVLYAQLVIKELMLGKI